MPVRLIEGDLIPGSPATLLELDGGERVPVVIRRSARARRVALRIQNHRRCVELVVPDGMRMAVGERFLDSRRGWIAARLAALPRPVPFVPGAVIPVFGIPRLLGTAPGRRGPIFNLTQDRIEIAGTPEQIAGRTKRGLIKLADAMLRPATRDLAARLGRRVGRISLGDPHARWGSCAASGNIRYSWRLVLAPESVARYVVAHEVAHLAQMNHGPKFWAIVEDLAPGYAAERAWLRRHGPELLSYGIDHRAD